MSGTMTGRAVTDRASAPSDFPAAEARPGETLSVLVEVGDGRGALVLYLADGYLDEEIEISPVGSAHRVHTGVLDRATAAGVVRAAVFGSLAAGSYTVWADDDIALGTVIVAAGQVTEWTSNRPVQPGALSPTPFFGQRRRCDDGTESTTLRPRRVSAEIAVKRGAACHS